MYLDNTALHCPAEPSPVACMAAKQLRTAVSMLFHNLRCVVIPGRHAHFTLDAKSSAGFTI